MTGTDIAKTEAGYRGFKEIIQPMTKTIRETERGLEIDFIISTEALDRGQDIISLNGWELENYRKNPVVLWAHNNYEPPVAKSLREWTEDGCLKSTALFTTMEVHRFGHTIGQMYKEGFLNAVSVGFKAIKAKWSKEDDRPYGADYEKQELLEYSCVPVPANPEALIDAKSAGIKIDDYFDMVIKCLDTKSFETIPQETAERLYKTLRGKSAFFARLNEPPTIAKSAINMYRIIKLNESRRKTYEF